MSADRSASRPRLPTVLLFALVTGVHFVSSLLLLFYVFGSGMARFDSGAPATVTESVAGWAFAIVSFPLLTLVERIPLAQFRGLWGYVPFAANACLWALAAVVVRRRLGARARRRADS